jgi:hypothetical protein
MSCSELTNSPGISITEAAQTTVGEVIEHHDMTAVFVKVDPAE